MHYQRWYRTQRASGKRPVRPTWEPADRFRAAVTVQPDGCHRWSAAVNEYGYGVFQVEPKRSIQAHIYAWMLAHDGQRPPAGQQIDHLCHVAEECHLGNRCPHRRCVNPEHLAVKTPRANTLRSNAPSAHNAVKERCPKGHAYDEANTCRRGGRRYCRACTRIKARAKRLDLTYEESAALDRGPRL